MNKLPAVLALLLLAGTACQSPRESLPRRDAAVQRHQSRTAEFDSYVLALSWAPAFCAQEGGPRSSRECDPGRSVGFVVHGLWPQRDSGGPVEYCGDVPPLSHAIVDDMLRIMPDRGLIQHEWRTHGSCSGLSSREYFSEIRQAFAKIRIPDEFSHLTASRTISTAQTERDFEVEGGFDGTPAVRIGCRGGELTEVRVCLSRSLQPIPCGPGVRDCRESRVLLRGVR